jgi:type I restriction enzyme S subunit
LPKDLDELFPDSFEDSALGPIPTGWRVGCVGDVCHIHDSRRKPLSSIERQAMQGGFPYYGAASVLDYVNSYLFDGIYLLLGEDGSVVQKDGTPVLQYVWDKFWVSNHAHVLTGKGISTEQLLIALRSTNISPFVTGAVQPKVSQGNMKSIPLVLPDDRIANELDRLIIPNYDTYRVNTHLIRTLTNLRDTLLPTLISGDLRVPEAEQMVAELGL